MTPASLSSVALTMTMNRIARLLRVVDRVLLERRTGGREIDTGSPAAVASVAGRAQSPASARANSSDSAARSEVFTPSASQTRPTLRHVGLRSPRSIPDRYVGWSPLAWA